MTVYSCKLHYYSTSASYQNSCIEYVSEKDFSRGGNMNKLVQILTKYHTSTTIRSGLNSHMTKSWKLIGAQYLEIKTSYLRETESCVQPSWIVSVYFELTIYKKILSSFFMEFLSELNVLNRSPYLNTKSSCIYQFWANDCQTFCICRNLLYLSVYSHYRCKYKQRHVMLHNRLQEANLDNTNFTVKMEFLFSSCKTIITLAKYIEISLKHHVWIKISPI